MLCSDARWTVATAMASVGLALELLELELLELVELLDVTFLRLVWVVSSVSTVDWELCGQQSYESNRH